MLLVGGLPIPVQRVANGEAAFHTRNVCHTAGTRVVEIVRYGSVAGEPLEVAPSSDVPVLVGQAVGGASEGVLVPIHAGAAVSSRRRALGRA